ncbi:MAG: VWA domain-containing protein [Pyrinomonadaceae bacterium]
MPTLSGRRARLPKYLALLLGSLLAFLISEVTIYAQEPGAEVDVLRVSTDLVVFPVRVVNKNRQSVRNLTERDFAFQDEDKVTTSAYFAAGAERVAMVFALDESGSLREIISQQRDTAIALFSRFKEESRIAVLRFAERPQLVVPFAKGAEDARAAFTFPAGHNRRTAIFDAAAAAINAFEGVTKDPAERRIIILISDGLDNASTLKPNSIVESARERNASFYVIHLPLFEPRDGRLAVRSPAKGFRELAEKTGGRYFLVGEKSPFAAPQKTDLSPIFQAIEDDIKSQYLVGFYVGDEARDGRSHRVSISLLQPGLVYSLGARGFSRTHHFSVKLLPKIPKSQD